jgi:adenylate kinase
MRLIMLGAPGAGKGTQAKILSEEYSIPHISTGDIFRYNIQKKTALGTTAAKYIDDGILVPDDITLKLIVDRLEQEDCKNGFILDGFPRTIHQANMLDRHMSEGNMNIDMVIFISITHETAEKRITSRMVCKNCGASYNAIHRKPKIENVCDICGSEVIKRKDDNLDIILERLKTYEKETAPLISYYEKQGKIEKIYGQTTIEETTKRVLEALKKL